VTLGYDPLGRLYSVASGGSTTRFLWDGDDLVAEYNGSNVLQRRYVHGPGIDAPLVEYQGTGTASTDRRNLLADERGSIVAVSSKAGFQCGEVLTSLPVRNDMERAANLGLSAALQRGPEGSEACSIRRRGGADRRSGPPSGSRRRRPGRGRSRRRPGP